MDVVAAAFTRSEHKPSQNPTAPRGGQCESHLWSHLCWGGEGVIISVELKELSSVSHSAGHLQVLRSRVDEVELRQAQRSVGLRQRPAANTSKEEEEEQQQ